MCLKDRNDQPRPGGWSSIRTILETVWQSGAAFARKVDPDERPEVLKAIDEKVTKIAGFDTPASEGGSVP